MNITENINPNSSWLKYRNITFNTRLCVATRDITTYKYLSRKLPDKFRSEIGPIKSYEEPDCYTVYNVGDTVRYALSLASKGSRQYDQDTRDYYVKYKITGIPSFIEKPFCYKKDWYESFVCECVIPKGSHYYEGYENGKLKCLLSDCVVVQKIVESKK